MSAQRSGGKKRDRDAKQTATAALNVFVYLVSSSGFGHQYQDSGLVWPLELAPSLLPSSSIPTTAQKKTIGSTTVTACAHGERNKEITHTTPEIRVRWTYSAIAQASVSLSCFLWPGSWWGDGGLKAWGKPPVSSLKFGSWTLGSDGSSCRKGSLFLPACSSFAGVVVLLDPNIFVSSSRTSLFLLVFSTSCEGSLANYTFVLRHPIHKHSRAVVFVEDLKGNVDVSFFSEPPRHAAKFRHFSIPSLFILL